MELTIAPVHMNLQLSPSPTEMEQAFYRKDASYDGVFFVAVRTTGIFCRPSCPSRPKPENIEFFTTIRDAVFAGYRPCKRCHPTEVYGALPDWVMSLMQRLEATPNAKITSAELRSLGITPERVRRWFREHYGMTFAEWCRGRRLADAFTRIREGAELDDVVFANGYESHSGFREAFSKTFGVSPGQSQNEDYIATQILETPLGVLLVGAVSQGICLIEYTDRRMLEHNYAEICKRFGYPVLPVTNNQIEHLRDELCDYFTGKLTKFTVPLVVHGTAFQERVWSELQRIPYGKTISYDEQAHQIGQPTAVRAVARANGMNRINILIPCHRVIGKDGQLTGYGGGLWRKRLLLELERTGKFPGNEASE
ncbi:methylated-DNA--[protein]-cysteine S-methyltransferase [Dendronalium sp. ChiSLP03b]|uniref:bifunctional transcriptional activator/DNA repair enzyme AdaA n=1 Tax=Dendronalium sp. ChiSLP03b TaxID=3075381 RepID=UPI002AD4E928|nr:methylated-DNA--[protein]-cysteine S-methyltransferase [Dendronalium sp. ChiSLP03b]MDZ8206297.1 methylated-DNA--[protein]-cysteine S-methyltransferase [Dendronalium sp. ChiSLP03b]